MTSCKTCAKPLNPRSKSGYCRTCYIPSLSPELKAERARKLSEYLAATDPADMKRRMAALSRRRMAWCPLEYQADYRRFTRAKCLPAATARRMIEEQIAADRERYARTGQLPQAARMAA